MVIRSRKWKDRSYNSQSKEKKTKRQAVHKPIYRNSKIEQHEPH